MRGGKGCVSWAVVIHDLDAQSVVQGLALSASPGCLSGKQNRSCCGSTESANYKNPRCTEYTCMLKIYWFIMLTSSL